MYDQKPENERSASLTCPLCHKEVDVVPFGNRFVAVCCNEVIYVGHHYPLDGPIKSDIGLRGAGRQDSDLH